MIIESSIFPNRVIANKFWRTKFTQTISKRQRELSLKDEDHGLLHMIETWWSLPKSRKNKVKILSRSSMMTVTTLMTLLSWFKQASWRILDEHGHHQDGYLLRIFGCLVYIHVPKDKRMKLETSGKKGTFVGYSESSKAYRLYIPG